MAALASADRNDIRDFLQRNAEQGSAALHHRRQRGRRKIHADRAAAARFKCVYEDQLASRQESRSIARPARSIFRC